MPQRRTLWRRHHALQGEGPILLVFPEGCWSELLPDARLCCQDTHTVENPPWRLARWLRIPRQELAGASAR